MKRMSILVALMAVAVMAASPSHVEAAAKKAKSEVVMKIGSRVHLFHSGNVEAQKEIAVGDVLTVYRELGGKVVQPKEVGEVKVLSFIGKHYFGAEIVKGSIKTGDIARKTDTHLLVQPAR